MRPRGSVLGLLVTLCVYVTHGCGPATRPQETTSRAGSGAGAATRGGRGDAAASTGAAGGSGSRAAGATVIDVSPSAFEDRGPGSFELLGRTTRGPLHVAYRFMRSGQAPDDRNPAVTYSWNQDLILVVDGRIWREAHVFAGDQQRMRRATADEDTPARGRRYWERYAPRSVGARGYDEWFAWNTEQRLRPMDPLPANGLGALRFVTADGVEQQPVDADGYFVFRSRPTGLFVVRLVHGERTLWAAEATTGTLACATPGETGSDEAEVHVRVHALSETQWVVVWSRTRSRRDCPEATQATSYEDDGGIAVVGGTS